MDSKQSSNKIRDIVRLQQLIKKWKKLAHASKIKTNNNTKYITLPPIKRSSSNNNINNPTKNSNSTGNKSIKFLKKTLSFTETTENTISSIKRSSSNNNINNPTNSSNFTGSKSIKFLKKTLSFTESSMSSNSSSNDVVPKGFLAVSVGRDEENNKKFVIPMEYLGHQAFAVLLREAEEEFGFQQEGVLKIPCEVAIFEKILKMMQQKNKKDAATMFLHSCEPTPTHNAQLCS